MVDAELSPGLLAGIPFLRGAHESNPVCERANGGSVRRSQTCRARVFLSLPADNVCAFSSPVPGFGLGGIFLRSGISLCTTDSSSPWKCGARWQRSCLCHDPSCIPKRAYFPRAKKPMERGLLRGRYFFAGISVCKDCSSRSTAFFCFCAMGLDRAKSVHPPLGTQYSSFSRYFPGFKWTSKFSIPSRNPLHCEV